MDALEERLRAAPIPLVLDVATGGGGFSAHLRREYEDIGTIVAVDVSPRGLERARSGLDGIRDLLPACMDSALLALSDERFDMVCISNSLHHMENLTATLDEMMRVLRPGGLFLVSEMYSDGQSETQQTHVMMHHWWAEIDRLSGIPHNGTFERDGIIDLIRGLGLEDVITGDYSFLEGDPLDADLLERLDKGIDAYFTKLEEAGGDSGLRQRGEALRQRLHTTGFHPASSLGALGLKP